eukprot:scaffold41109_cov26-Tisochrysis_lutea.AAC.1
MCRKRPASRAGEWGGRSRSGNRMKHAELSTEEQIDRACLSSSSTCELAMGALKNGLTKAATTNLR